MPTTSPDTERLRAQLRPPVKRGNRRWKRRSKQWAQRSYRRFFRSGINHQATRTAAKRERAADKAAGIRRSDGMRRGSPR